MYVTRQKYLQKSANRILVCLNEDDGEQKCLPKSVNHPELE